MSASGRPHEIEVGADVVCSDGEKVGSVDFVVVDPASFHITDVVVSTGPVLGRDIIVPLGSVERIEPKRVVLTLDKPALERCPDYVEINYQSLPTAWPGYGMAGLSYPPDAVLAPGSMDVGEAGGHVNAPEGTVGLYEGMEVNSSDGHRVGRVDALDLDDASESVKAIVIKHGLLHSHEIRIPIEHVSTVEEDRVQLDIRKDEIERGWEA